MDKKILTVAAISGAIVVGLGAFGAHGLEPLLAKNQRLDTFDTAVQYHMFHTLALLAMSLIDIKKRRTIALLFTLGIVIFSGSLYVLSITNISIMGAITPIGGVLFITGWIFLAYQSGSREKT
jgi:uncharacterized membrane protein YgdD (TMEM256/DUF423 family)